MNVRCNAVFCHDNADRTVVWQTDGKLYDYTHECKGHAIESANSPFAYHASGLVTLAAVIPGIRNLNIGANNA